MSTTQNFNRGDVIVYSYFSDKYISQVVEDLDEKVQLIPIFDLTIGEELSYVTLLTKKESMSNIVTLGNHPLPGDIIREQYQEYLI